MDDVSNDVCKRVECVGARDLKRRRMEARDQPYRNFKQRVGARAVSDSVEAFTILYIGAR